jgi:hypothetical protein
VVAGRTRVTCELRGLLHSVTPGPLQSVQVINIIVMKGRRHAVILACFHFEDVLIWLNGPELLVREEQKHLSSHLTAREARPSP